MELFFVTPIKVFLNNNEEITAASKMGTNGDLDAFLSQIGFKTEGLSNKIN